MTSKETTEAPVEASSKKKKAKDHYDPRELKLITDPKHPLYDKRVHDEPSEEFIANIEHYGQLQAISIVIDPETGEPLVAAGRKRTKALIRINERLVKKGLEPRLIEAKTVRREDIGDRIGIMISENEHRSEDTPAGRREKAARMLEHKPEVDVAKAFGVSVFTLRNMMAVADAPAFIRAAADSGKITDTASYKLAKMDPGEAKKKLDELLERAPRIPGKKRATRANAEVERKILGGKKRVYMTAAAAANIDAAPTEAVSPLAGAPPPKAEKAFKSKGSSLTAPEVFGRRGDNQIENVVNEILAGRLSDDVKAAIKSFAGWILGDDEALMVLGLKPHGAGKAAE